MTPPSSPQRQQQLQELVQKLGIFDPAPVSWILLDLALIHPSASASSNYEQLEFLGDSVVRLAVAEWLLQYYSGLSVGEFAALRSILVSDRTLAQIAREYDLDRYLLVSSSALRDQTGQESRLAEALEAVLGALYLSTHTLELVHPWLVPHLEKLAVAILSDPARQNYKAALQQWTQAQYKTLPEYRVTETGQAHADPHRFTAEVWLQGQQLGQGTGKSIKAAEQAAAQVALLRLQPQEIGENQ